MQTTRLQLALERFLAARPYYPCCLLTHPDIRRLQHAADLLHSWYAWPTLMVGAVLSAALLSVAPAQRASLTSSILAAAIQPYAPGPLLCSQLDLLFEPTLLLDPLRLLCDASRLATLVVLWPGTLHQGTLAYAVPEHAHYRVWHRLDLAPEGVLSL